VAAALTAPDAGSTEPWEVLVGSIDGVRGPTPTSHWLIKGRVLVGSCPGTHTYDPVTDEKQRCSRETVQSELSALQVAGVSQFFNFQQRMEEKHCRPYYANQLERVWAGHGDTPVVNRFPTVDGGTWPQTELAKITDAVEQSLRGGHVIYLHCYGGHGRAGIVAAMTLNRVYGVGADDALAVVQRRHGARERSMDGHRSPACEKQVEQVKKCCR
jgi:protein-tyrosine phosphatase